MRKDKYSLPLLEAALEAYQDLKQDEKYQLTYKGYKIIQNKLNRAYKRKDKNDFLPLLDLFTEASIAIERHWRLKHPIDPNLNIKKEDLQKSIRSKSSVARLIEAFNITPYRQTKKEKKISKQRFEMEKRAKKFQCYTMHKSGKSLRWLGRNFEIDKDTAKNWSNEVADWSEADKNKVLSEFVISKAIKDRDAYDTEESMEIEDERSIKVFRSKSLQSLHEIDYALTNEGLYKTGQKKQHKAPDKEQED